MIPIGHHDQFRPWNMWFNDNYNIISFYCLFYTYHIKATNQLSEIIKKDEFASFIAYIEFSNDYYLYCKDIIYQITTERGLKEIDLKSGVALIGIPKRYSNHIRISNKSSILLKDRYVIHIDFIFKAINESISCSIKFIENLDD